MGELTDKELIQLAARAVFGDMAGQMIESGWNPLTNRAAALDLALTLAVQNKMRVAFADDGVTAYQNWDGFWVPHTWIYSDIQTPGQCFCRAVTRAASEVGKLMKEQQK